MTDALERALERVATLAAAAQVGARAVLLPDDAGFRHLSNSEIERLERQGCEAENWAGVRVSAQFDAAHLVRVRFAGEVRIGRTGTRVRRAAGFAPASGLRDATVVDARIGDDVMIDRVGLLHRTVVGDRATIASCAELSHAPGATFGNGHVVQLSCSPGGRPVRAVAEMPFSVAAAMAGHPGAAALSLDRALEDWAAGCASGFAVVGADAVVSGAGRIHAAWIGPGAEVRGTLAIEHSTVLSSADRPARVLDGALLRHALVQWQAEVIDGAQVHSSLVCEGATVTRQAVVLHSVIGPDCFVAEGEISKSLVGPLVGFHHRALLVAAYWPDGRGNIGQGANVGSNHTGKAPDQELHVGEGAFFGLGVNVKLPADYSEAPYLLVAAGVDTLPQRVTMPFSLILPAADRPGALSPAINEIRPGWMLVHNAYGLERNAVKYERRQQAVTEPVDPDVFRPEIIDRIDRAWDDLSALAGQPWFSDRDLGGLGKNFCTDEARLEAVEAYRHAVRRFAFGRVLDRLERGLQANPGVESDDRSWEHARRLILRHSSEKDPAALVRLFLAEERRWAAAVLDSKRRDDVRGARIIPDYAAAHPPAEEDDVVRHAQQRMRRAAERAAALGIA